MLRAKAAATAVTVIWITTCDAAAFETDREVLAVCASKQTQVTVSKHKLTFGETEALSMARVLAGGAGFR